MNEDSVIILKAKFGFIPFPADPVTAIETTVQAEKAGFQFTWVPDTFVDISPPAGFNPWVVLAAIAARTRKIKLATGVTDTQRQHPARTAQLASTLDVISNGRAVLGIGAGEAMNILAFHLPWEDPEGRAERFIETIEIVQLLWGSSRKQRVTFNGKFYSLTDAFLEQAPKRKPHPPLFIGACSSKRMLQIVGKYADGWIAWQNTPETFKKRWGTISEAAQSANRSPRQIEPWSHLMVAFPKNSREEKAALLTGKVLLLTERTVLRSLGEKVEQAEGHQDLRVSMDGTSRIREAAGELRDDLVYETMAIGLDEVENKLSKFSSVGLTNFAVVDLLAPKGLVNTMKMLRRVIAEHR
jgi:phthiodiolone/phenolphthiodiolone dimycocerosates ketoreductase